ncbi:protein of unknown function [Candidatus Nitrosocaldus cavascurensis]|uniref:Uncharacterized protein n=1 Tax=Candidatus Nitrosocaldus cavascurensis TaxID=2058097 RepID=A0A2K5AQ64_9ARCH|nr:protein of unknown function [Candidatus Nitrosocaldus cavascurensis]
MLRRISITVLYKQLVLIDNDGYNHAIEMSFDTFNYITVRQVNCIYSKNIYD